TVRCGMFGPKTTLCPQRRTGRASRQPGAYGEFPNRSWACFLKTSRAGTPSSSAAVLHTSADGLRVVALESLESTSRKRSLRPHGNWIRRLSRSRFDIEDLIEVRPPEDAATSYPFVELEWARKWPCEEIWKARKRR